ncbi:MAG: glycosyltransferase [Gemmobacter sp.]|nr:glycosyltransferase [Gemmobacter sp.]
MIRPPRVMFYVQHLLGIGHLARASRIATALADAGASVTVVTGGLPVPGFPSPGVDHIALPAISAAEGFAGLVDAQGEPIDDQFKQRRRDALIDAFHHVKPDLVLTEAFPFGRRQVRFEMLPLIDAIHATTPRPILCASIRDILQERAKPGRDAETVALVRDHYDHVLVHGDPNFVRLEDTFPLASEIAHKVIYTGLVAGPVPEPSPDRFDIVVSAGGGAVGAGVLQAASEASLLLPDIKRWCLIAGPNLPQADFDRFSQNLRDGVELTRFRVDFTALLGAARLSVSQAGYNTICDILGAGCRALLVPFASGGETEQTARANRFAALGRMTSLPEDRVTGQSLAQAITATLAKPIGNVGQLKTDGAERTAQIVLALSQGNPPYMSIT